MKTQKSLLEISPIMVSSLLYNEQDGIFVPDKVLKEHDQSREFPRWICGGTVLFGEYELIVEAVSIGHRGYALRNVNGTEIKWVTRTELLDKINKS